MKIPPSARSTHIYIPGMTQHGKSTLITHLALHDIQQGYGVCVMDGKGDFIPKFLNYIPDFRVEDTIYLDVTRPVPLDFIGCHGEREKDKLVDEIKYLLTKTTESQHIPTLSRNIEDILRTLFNYNDNPDTPDHCRATFLDIAYFIDDPNRQKVILSRLTDADLQRRWATEPIIKQDAARILSRMNPFIRSQTLRNIFGGKKPKLNIAAAIHSHKVLLVNLALGGIDEIQRIYGILLLAKIRQTMLRQTDIPDKSKITKFYLYCDEFQEFQTSDFPKMLSQAGGLGLCLTLAHQYVDQLTPDILHAIKGNVSTYICFRLGEESMNAIKSVFPKVPNDRREKYRKEIQAKIDRVLTEKELWLNKLPPPRDDDEGLTPNDHPKIKELNHELIWLYHDLEHLPASFSNIPDTSLLPFLGVGEVLYRAADASAYKIHTPAPLTPPPISYAEYIKFRTIQTYACQSSPECSNEDDGNTDTQSDDIPPSGATTPPRHGRKKKGA